VEVGAEETRAFFQNPEIRGRALQELKRLGFETVELSLTGYRTGRFNPVQVSGLSSESFPSPLRGEGISLKEAPLGAASQWA